jgi:hypothetical protein
MAPIRLLGELKTGRLSLRVVDASIPGFLVKKRIPVGGGWCDVAVTFLVSFDSDIFPHAAGTFVNKPMSKKKLAIENSGLVEFDSTQSAVARDRWYGPSCRSVSASRAAAVMANIFELFSSSPTLSYAQSIQ